MSRPRHVAATPIGPHCRGPAGGFLTHEKQLPSGQHVLPTACPQPALPPPPGLTSRESRDLRTSCQSNLASCALQLGQWGRCAELCGTVLAADAANRKALYRRGEPAAISRALHAAVWR